MAISDQLTSINTSKLAIKAALTAKGLTPSNTLSTYAGNINSLSTGVSDAWVRPADWLPMPTVLATEEKFVGLYAVFPNDNLADSSNYVAISAYGNYTVDWGDGSSSENFAQATTAYHVYDYNNSLLANTVCSRGYKQVIVTLTPQSGQTLYNFSVGAPHFRSLLNGSSGWLDMTLSMPNGTSGGVLTIGSASMNHNLLEQVNIKTIGNINSILALFAYTNSLKSIPLFDTSKVINASQMFRSNKAIKTIPAYDFSLVTTLSNFANSAINLISVGAIKTSTALISTTSMFASCSSLTSAPLFVTSNVTDASQMFNGCAVLLNFPFYDFSSVQNASFMFSNCYSVLNFPNYNFSNVTNATQMFNACNSLISIPAYNFSNVTTGNFTTIFASCSSLVKSNVTGVKFAHSYSTDRLSPNALTTIMNNLPTATTNQTITISNNWGSTVPIGYTNCATTNKNTAITVTSPTVATVTFTATTNLVTTSIAHGFLPNQKVTFQTIVTTSGISVNTTYYVVNISSSTAGTSIPKFQLALTADGVPLPFTTGTGTLLLVSIGSQVTGTGSPLTTPIVMAFTNNTVVLTNHLLQVNDIVTFTTVTNGLVTYTPYYIVGTPNTGDFQIATTLGGAAITFTNGTGTMLYDSVVESVSGTASPFTINMSRPMTANGTGVTLAFRPLKTSIALFKNWTVA